MALGVLGVVLMVVFDGDGFGLVFVEVFVVTVEVVTVFTVVEGLGFAVDDVVGFGVVDVTTFFVVFGFFGVLMGGLFVAGIVVNSNEVVVDSVGEVDGVSDVVVVLVVDVNDVQLYSLKSSIAISLR